MWVLKVPTSVSTPGMWSSFNSPLEKHKWLGAGNGSIREWNEPLHYTVVACLFHHVKWQNDAGISYNKCIAALNICQDNFWATTENCLMFINSSCKQNRLRLQATFLPFDAYARVCLMAGGMHNYMVSHSLTAKDSLVTGIFQKWPATGSSWEIGGLWNLVQSSPNKTTFGNHWQPLCIGLMMAPWHQCRFKLDNPWNSQVSFVRTVLGLGCLPFLFCLSRSFSSCWQWWNISNRTWASCRCEQLVDRLLLFLHR